MEYSRNCKMSTAGMFALQGLQWQIEKGIMTYSERGGFFQERHKNENDSYSHPVFIECLLQASHHAVKGATPGLISTTEHCFFQLT